MNRLTYTSRDATRNSFVLLAFVLLAFGLVLPAAAQLSTSTWTGAVSTDWTDADNWDGDVPDADTAVVFDQTTANLPLVRGTAYSMTFKSTLTAPFETTLSGTTINLWDGGIIVEAGAPSIRFENSSSRGINVRRPLTTPFVNNSAGTLFSFRYLGQHGSGVGYAEFNGVGDFEIRQGSGSVAVGWILHEDFTGSLLAPSSNSHEASTILNGGTLVLDGTLRSPRYGTREFTVNSGATVTGNGRIATPYANSSSVDININNGGKVNPGRVGETGTLTFENWDVNFNEGATLRLDLLDPTDHDKLEFALTGSHANNVLPTLNLATAGVGVILDLNLLPGFAGAIDDEFEILSGYQAVNGYFKLADGTSLTDGAEFEVDGTLFRINYGSTTLTVIPEPGAGGLLLLGLAGMLCWRRRR